MNLENFDMLTWSVPKHITLAQFKIKGTTYRLQGGGTNKPPALQRHVDDDEWSNVSALDNLFMTITPTEHNPDTYRTNWSAL